MQPSSVSDIQKELKSLPPKDVIQFCMRLVKYKKENKELMTYLLHHSSDEEGYIQLVKQEVTEDFGDVNQSSFFLAKKTIRKILRKINKYSRYSGVEQTELELRTFFCLQLKESGIKIHQHKVLENLYNGQLKKIDSVFNKLHEDLQYDFRKVIEELHR
jgi:hypothetical protein